MPLKRKRVPTIDAGIAKRLDNPVCMDAAENIVESKEEVVVMKEDVAFTRPDNGCCVDETGSNTNMKSDCRNCCQRVIAERGHAEHREAMTSYLHYTSLCFTAFFGKPVIFAVILPLNNGNAMPSNWVAGIDLAKLPIGINDDVDFPTENSEPGKYLPGG